MRSIFMVFPLIWFLVVFYIIGKIISAGTKQNNQGKNNTTSIHNFTNLLSGKADESSGRDQNTGEWTYPAREEPPHPEDFTEPKAYSGNLHKTRLWQPKTLEQKLNGEDQPKRGKLSRESREDEKDWF